MQWGVREGVRKLLERGLRWRLTTGYTADRFFYNSFSGGNDSSWALTTTTYARFDDFKVGSTAASVQQEGHGRLEAPRPPPAPHRGWPLRAASCAAARCGA